MSLRLPGGGKRIKKKISRRWMHETIKRQQLVINALAMKLDEGRRLVQEVLSKSQEESPKVESVPLIVPVGRTHE